MPGSARQIVAALADVFGLDDAAPMLWRAQMGNKAYCFFPPTPQPERATKTLTVRSQYRNSQNQRLSPPLTGPPHRPLASTG